MTKFSHKFIGIVDGFNYRVGRVMMYGIFVMMGILLWSSISKTFFLPSLWTLEMAQFAMVAYYILGGPYSIQLGANVRMDLLYNEWPVRKKAWFDLITVLMLIFYLCVLLYGAIGSTAYSLGYWGKDPITFFWGLLTGAEEIGRIERSASSWQPIMWPIKAIMIVGIFMMVLQATSEFLKDLLRLRGEPI
jgi:TRAP-type mannitol/chloroaromatic compound transport system permease small subunit